MTTLAVLLPHAQFFYGAAHIYKKRAGPSPWSFCLLLTLRAKKIEEANRTDLLFALSLSRNGWLM
jgi:hypothetical protein